MKIKLTIEEARNTDVPPRRTDGKAKAGWKQLHSDKTGRHRSDDAFVLDPKNNEAPMACYYLLIWLSVLLLVLLPSVQRAAAQGGRAQQTDNSRFESITTYDTHSFIIYGRVALANGSPPARLVTIERVCKDMVQAGGFADSRGRFSFDLGVLNRSLEERSIIGAQNSNQAASKRINPEDLSACEVRASLNGYRSDSLPLSPVATGKKSALGTITLIPLAKSDAPALSPNDGQGPKNARGAYDRGLDAAAKANWPEAIECFEKATSLYPKYTSAWLGLGMLQGGSNKMGAALHSYTQAIAVDGHFALPYIESAVLENIAGQWDKVLEHTDKALQFLRLLPRSPIC
jgi:tetratricopeptide (TPR) repeat protein